MQLNTKRLTLRPTTQQDGPVLLAYSADPQFRRYEEHPCPTEDEFRDIIRWIIGTEEEIPRLHYYFTIALSAKVRHPIGSIFVSIRDHDNRQGEIGYMLGVPYWNQGYVTEAAACIVRFGFEELNLHRLYADNIISENIGSIRVMENWAFAARLICASPNSSTGVGGIPMSTRCCVTNGTLNTPPADFTAGAVLFEYKRRAKLP